MEKWLASTGKPFWSKFFNLALPVSLQSMMFAALGMFDVMMVATLGEAEIAAVGLGGKVFFFNLLAVFGISGAINILGAQYFGAGENKGIRKILIQSITWAFIINAGFALFYTLNPSFFVTLSSQDPQLIELGATYLQITGWTILVTAIIVPLESALRVSNDVMAPTVIGILAIIINASLNVVLIFGVGPIDPMGVAGAAWATVIGRMSQLLFMMLYIKYKQPMLIPTLADIKGSLLRSEMFKFIRFIAPILFQHAGWALGILTYSLIIAAMGTQALAIHSLIAPIEGMFLSAFFGLSSACGIMVGNELGANKFERAWYQSWTAVYTGVLLALSTAGLLALNQHHLLSYLQQHEFQNSEMIVNVSLVLALGLALKVHNMMGINGVLKSGGDVKYSAFIDLFGLWAVGIPAVMVAALVWQWPLHWVLLMMLSEEIVKAILTIQRMLKKRWLTNLVVN
ncbi:MATE family efflux transporter [Psychromonas sp. psych-6C06]|uniref:MATE family efflux transporter n=1 Tax=Psychromonas sp. psych-6C06 TaxID=2058089 RepID=UPI000C33E86F|nr:MATE family efflux transporter [Psychromonas sp. psych-6C06]PKF63287.1 MATE family efflux transporter [Psychromonas sp. psych-6C06]